MEQRIFLIWLLTKEGNLAIRWAIIIHYFLLSAFLKKKLFFVVLTKRIKYLPEARLTFRLRQREKNSINEWIRNKNRWRLTMMLSMQDDSEVPRAWKYVINVNYLKTGNRSILILGWNKYSRYAQNGPK